VAVGLARDRCGDRAELHVSALPACPLAAPVDLVVAAEVLYYADDVPAALAALWAGCRPGGHLAVLHWAHAPHDTRLSGPQVHAMVADQAADRGAARLVGHVEPGFLLDVYEAAA
jgi:trans-aconitate methyltransferase